MKFTALKLFFNSNVFPLILVFAALGTLLVLFRMNNVEIGYKIAFVNRDMKKAVLENKELKVKKAKLLSSNQLKKFAKKYKLRQPKQKQIIIIPQN